MNVKQLIEALQAQDPEKMVVIHGYEGGVNEITLCEPEKVILNYSDEWYYGKHEISEKGDCDVVYIE